MYKLQNPSPQIGISEHMSTPMDGPLGICPDPGPWPYLKPCTHTCMNTQSYICVDTEVQAHVHNCTYTHIHVHSYRIHVHKHPDPGPRPIDKFALVHTYTHLRAPRGICTQMPRPEPMDTAALMHVHIHGCPEVPVHRHHGPGYWVLVHSCTHVYAFMSNPTRRH